MKPCKFCGTEGGVCEVCRSLRGRAYRLGIHNVISRFRRQAGESVAQYHARVAGRMAEVLAARTERMAQERQKFNSNIPVVCDICSRRGGHEKWCDEWLPTEEE